MKLLLFSKQSFLIEEIKKSTQFANTEYKNDFLSLYSSMKDGTTIMYHLDSDEEFEEHINQLNTDFKDLKIIAIRNNTNNIEGCRLLKKGCKAYAHSIYQVLQFEDIIKAVNNGNVWMYPELMQFLISSVPLKEKNENKLLEKLTIKELEVLELVSQGLNNNEISKTLDLAEVTIKKYISSLFKKLNLKDRLSLALFFKNNA